MKKAYTLLEILIVVIILALMIGVFWFYLPNRDDEQIKYWKECSNYLYQIIQSEINYQEKNKSEIISWVLYYPRLKIINFIKTNNAYDNTIQIKSFFYDYIWFIEKTPLKWWIPENNTSEKYIISIDWEFSFMNSITINEDKFKSQNRINETILLSCLSHDQNTCTPISKIIFNDAAQIITQKFCLDFSWSTCNQWEQ